MATTSLRPVPKRFDSTFFSIVAFLIAIAVFIGFAHSYFLAGMFFAKLPSLLVHLHGALFVGWILLLLVQVALAATGHVRAHMKLGIAGMLMGTLMVPVGFATLRAAVRRHFDTPESTRIIVAVDSMILTIFAALLLMAWLNRKNTPFHKRYILLATSAILAPAVARWPFHFMESAFAVLLVLNLFPAFLIAYDLWSLKKIHRATIFGTVPLIFWQLVYIPLAHLALMGRVIEWMEKT